MPSIPQPPSSSRPHTTGLLSFLPPSWVSYAELGRLEQFKGILTTLPCTAGSLFAACIQRPTPPALSHIIKVNLFLLLLTHLLDATGCAWNDFVDQDLDHQVARCSNRPLARGALSSRAALGFIAGLYVLVIGVLWVGVPEATAATRARTSFWTLLFILLGTVYPFAKRVTHNAQVVLGVCYCLCIPIGCAAMGVEPSEIDTRADAAAMLCLMGNCMVWVIIIDTIYAFQDLKDDKRIGIKAMTVRFEKNFRSLLYGLAVLKGLLLFATGWLIDATSPVFYVSAVMSCLTLIEATRKMELNDPGSLMWWFVKGGALAYGLVVSGLLSQYLGRL